jgi:RimJ/RimL family protein N-acetyltransferase
VIVLETARLRLRRFSPGDLDRLVALDSDPEVMRYISFGAPTPRERYAQEILPRWLAGYEASPMLGYWAAESREDSVFVGWFHLRPDRFDPDEQELGYRLVRTAWGRGLATEGSRSVLAHGFERAGAAKISARTLAQNARSRRVMQKCGLRYECSFVYPEDVIAGRSETERAAVKYSITQSGWAAVRR